MAVDLFDPALFSNPPFDAVVAASPPTVHYASLVTGSAVDVSPFSVNAPAGLAAGDLWLVAISFDTGTAAAITTPAGWTLVGTQLNNTVDGQRSLLYYKVAGAGETSQAFSFTTAPSGNETSWISLRVSNSAGVGAFSTQISNTASTAPPANGGTLTPQAANSTALWIAASDFQSAASSNVVWTAPTGYSGLTTYSNNNWNSLAVASRALTGTAAETPTGGFPTSGATNGGAVSWLVELKPGTASAAAAPTRGVFLSEVASVTAASFTTTAQTTTGGANSAVYVMAGIVSGATATLTDSKGNTYTLLTSGIRASQGARYLVWYCNNFTGGAGHTWTVTADQTTAIGVSVIEVLGTSGAVDANTGLVLDDAAPFTYSITTTSANTFVVGLFSSNIAAFDAPFTFASGTSGVNYSTNVAHATAATAGTYSTVVTTSGSTDVLGILVSLRPAGGGAGTVTGTSTQTLGAVSGSGSASVRVNSASTDTLDAFTGSGTASVRVNVTATDTLDAFTGSGTASVRVNVTAVDTLDAFTGSAATSVRVTGSSTGTLGQVTQASSASVGAAPITASSTATLGAITGAATASATVTGSSTQVLGQFTTNGATSVAVGATATQTIGAVTGSAATSATVAGSASQTLGAFTGSGSASVRVAGSASSTLASVTQTSAGTVSLAASSTGTLAPVTQNSSVIVGAAPILASSTQTLGGFTGSGSVTSTIGASATQTLGAVTGTGSTTAPITGTSTGTLGGVTQTASAAVRVSGASTATLGRVTGAGTASAATSASSTQALAPFTGTGSASVAVTGASTQTLGQVTGSGSALRAILGTSSATLGRILGEGFGQVRNPATASQFVAYVFAELGERKVYSDALPVFVTPSQTRCQVDAAAVRCFVYEDGTDAVVPHAVTTASL